MSNSREDEEVSSGDCSHWCGTGEKMKRSLLTEASRKVKAGGGGRRYGSGTNWMRRAIIKAKELPRKVIHGIHSEKRSFRKVQLNVHVGV